MFAIISSEIHIGLSTREQRRLWLQRIDPSTLAIEHICGFLDVAVRFVRIALTQRVKNVNRDASITCLRQVVTFAEFFTHLIYS